MRRSIWPTRALIRAAYAICYGKNLRAIVRQTPQRPDALHGNTQTLVDLLAVPSTEKCIGTPSDS